MSSPTPGGMNKQHIWGGYEFSLQRPHSNAGPTRGAPGSVAVTRAGVFVHKSPTESVKYLSNRYLDCLELAEDPPTSEVI
jgi:hypothetical protein